MLLVGPEERETALETLDDIVFQNDGTASDLLQTKHHCTAASLTDMSAELWKTVRVWSVRIKDGTVRVPQTNLLLITTAAAPVESIAAMLSDGRTRNPDKALQRLRQAAADSTNVNLSASFSAFVALSDDQQKNLVTSMTVLDNSPNINSVGQRIQDRIRLAVDREHRDALYERLEGWWLGRVIDQLRSPNPLPIVGFEVSDKLRSIAQQFGPDALPIDYLEAKPGELNPSGDTRMFVRQLRMIDVGTPRIEKAMLDYYRAFEQRSRWAREELLIGDEVEIYERRLIDEWERYSAAITEELGSTAADAEQKKAGRQIFNWMDQTADFRIRANVTEPYVMRGSFHLLADKAVPKVWWHPKFLDRLAALLGAKS